jgi:hypothetical protein
VAGIGFPAIGAAFAPPGPPFPLRARAWTASAVFDKAAAVSAVFDKNFAVAVTADPET